MVSRDLVNYNRYTSPQGRQKKTLNLGAVVLHFDKLIKDHKKINDADSEGNTPLHLSIKKGFIQKTQLLMNYGASLRLRNNEGKYPFDYLVAKHFNSSKWLKLFKKYSDPIDLDRRSSNENKSALHIVIEKTPSVCPSNLVYLFRRCSLYNQTPNAADRIEVGMRQKKGDNPSTLLLAMKNMKLLLLLGESPFSLKFETSCRWLKFHYDKDVRNAYDDVCKYIKRLILFYGLGNENKKKALGVFREWSRGTLLAEFWFELLACQGHVEALTIFHDMLWNTFLAPKRNKHEKKNELSKTLSKIRGKVGRLLQKTRGKSLLTNEFRQLVLTFVRDKIGFIPLPYFEAGWSNPGDDVYKKEIKTMPFKEQVYITSLNVKSDITLFFNTPVF